MANTYKNAAFNFTGVNTVTIYTAPYNTTSLVKSAYVANSGSTTGQINLWWTDFSDTAKRHGIIWSGAIPHQSSLDVVSSTFVLESGDAIQGFANTGNFLDITLAVLEMT